MPLKRLSIVIPLSLAVVTLATSFLVGLGLLAYHREKARLYEDLHQRSAILADQLSASFALPLRNRDHDQIEKLLDGAMLNPHVLGLVVRPADAATPPTSQFRDAQWRAVSATAPRAEPGQWVETCLITFGDDVLGQLDLYVSPRWLQARLAEIRRNATLVLFVFAALLIGSLILLLWRMVLRPLQAIEQYAAAVSDELGTAAPPPARQFQGELASLWTSLNKMLHLLQTRYEQIQASSAQLRADEARFRQLAGVLQENEERYRSLVETSFDWIWEIGPDGRYTYASPRVRELLGYAPEEVLGRTPFDFMPPAEAQRVQTAFAAIAAQRQPFTAIENVNQHRDGRLVVLETSGVPIFAADGTWLGYRGMDRDVTKRVEAERTLRLQGAALQAAANAVVITDRQGLIEWVNPAFVALSGWEAHEARGKNPGILIKSGDHEPDFYRQMWETILAGEVWRGEVTNRRKDGSRWIEEMTITPLRDARGDITHFIAIKQDVTQQKAMELHLLQTQRLEAVGTLASGIAHDLNNILSPILMVSGLIRTKLTADEDKELLAMMVREARRGADIIRQLLTFSRGLEGQRRIVQPRYILKELVTMMRETFPREIELHHEIAPELWAVEADHTQLHQILLNLCVNARDALADGGQLHLRATNLTLERDDALLPAANRPGPYICIEVRDTGHGIPPEILHRIFDPFFTTKPQGKGTGLGLSTVLGLVQRHEGFVTVASAPGEGARFKVYLPATPGQAAGDPGPDEPALELGQNQLVLVVDDERNIREALRSTLQKHGYQVHVAGDGKVALDLYREHQAELSLIITDLMMPTMNGLALIKAVRAHDPVLPIIATSGLGDVDHGPELAALGVTEILTKPYTITHLLSLVRHQLPTTPPPSHPRLKGVPPENAPGSPRAPRA